MAEKENYEEYDDVGADDIAKLVGESQDPYQNSQNAQAANMIEGMTAERNKDNFLHHQIATEEMIERLEHFYKGDYIGPDENGDMIWNKQTDDKLITLNAFGVASLMEIITKYIDRNTILSYYNESRIYEILADVGDEITLFIQCNYESMGMDTYQKKTKFRLIVITTLHIIESTYRRALNGNTMEEINQSKVIGQFGIGSTGIDPGRPRKRPNFIQRLANR